MINVKSTQLLGHRGARNEVLENTLAGFQHAHALRHRGLNGIEFDIQLTADGHLIVFHDETLQRLCGVQSRVDQLTLSEIRRHSQYGHPILTLDNLVSFPYLNSATVKNDKQSTLLSGFKHIELEIKTHDRTNYSLLIAALTRSFANPALAHLPITLTSFDLLMLAKLQNSQRLRKITRGLLIRTPKDLLTATNTALQLGCQKLGIYYPLLTPTVINHCHRYGLPVSAWTVNDHAHIQQLIIWQVDFIITDIPSSLL